MAVRERAEPIIIIRSTWIALAYGYMYQLLCCDYSLATAATARQLLSCGLLLFYDCGHFANIVNFQLIAIHFTYSR